MRSASSALVLLTLLAAGCGRGERSLSEAVSTPAPTPSGSAGRVTSTVSSPPPRQAPPPCTPSPQLVLGADRGLADVLVHVPDAPGAPPSTLELSGDGCVFNPPAALLVVGGELVVANDGEGLQTFHIHRLDGAHELTEQNLALPPGGNLLRWRFATPGRYRITADTRPWMEAFVQVVDRGLTARSDAEGRFSLDLPPGDWPAAVWHPTLGRRNDSIHVPEDGPGSLYITWSQPGEDARLPAAD